MADQKVIPLDDLLNEIAGHVSIAGFVHPIKAVNAAQYQRIVTHDWGTGNLQPILDIVREVAPTIDADALTLAAVTRITQIAVGIVVEVENALPNSSGPVAGTPPAIESHAP